MPKTYEYTIKDDALNQEFEQALTKRGKTFQDVVDKELADMVQHDREEAEKAKLQPTERPDLTDKTEAAVDGVKVEASVKP